MNAVSMTIDQLERGMTLYGNPTTAQLAGRVASCEREGLAPADVAAWAMHFRWAPVVDALGGCFDMKTEAPERYAMLAIKPIEALGLDYDFLDGELTEVFDDRQLELR